MALVDPKIAINFDASALLKQLEEQSYLFSILPVLTPKMLKDYGTLTISPQVAGTSLWERTELKPTWDKITIPIKDAWYDEKAFKELWQASFDASTERTEAVTPPDTPEASYLDDLIKSVNSDLPKLDRTLKLKTLKQRTVIRASGDFRKQAVPTSVEFIFDSCRLGKKGNLIMRFTPITPIPENDLGKSYEYVECPWSEAMEDVLGFDDAIMEVLGTDLADAITAAKTAHDAKMRQAKKSAAQIAAENAKESAEADDLWGTF